MSEGVGWAAIRERRMAEPGAAEAYDAARLAFELGRSVRELRERRGWSQTQLAKESGMTQSAVARFEAGGTVPTLAVLERLAAALGVSLRVGFEPRGEAA
ncbi:MAG TPA: helix-turn-helix transcriptional regulator [Actinoplanes sp.]|nr:helix-turn-helix transcriptional regulator [Actinoplanes sp.]